MWRQKEWEEMRQKIINLQTDFALFNAEFFERERFKRFTDDLFNQIGNIGEICITGYFSEATRKQLERVIKISDTHVRMICPHFPIRSTRDRKNLEALAKLNKAGAKIRVNDRLHARFLVAYSPTFLEIDEPVWRGLLLIGSFDFNTECTSMERYDAGIKTSHPDLIASAVKLFEEIWTESSPLGENYENEIKKMKISGY